MENKRKEIALLLKSRQCLKMLSPDLYPSREEIIQSIEKDIRSAEKILRKAMPIEERYKHFFNISNQKKGIIVLIDIIRRISLRRIPIFSDVKRHCQRPTIKSAEKAGLIFSLKEVQRREYFLNLAIEKLNFEILPPFSTALAYLSLSHQYFKTRKAAFMSLKSQIRPTWRGIKEYLSHMNETEVYELKNPERFKRRCLVFRLTERGALIRQNIISLARGCGLSERDLVTIDTPEDTFQGYRVLHWNKDSKFHFDNEKTEELIHLRCPEESKYLPKPRVRPRNKIQWFNSTAKRLRIKPETPLILTERGEKILETFGKAYINNQKVYSAAYGIGMSEMRMYIPVLLLIRAYGFLPAREFYEKSSTYNCKGIEYGFPGAIRDMLEKSLIKYASFNHFNKLIHDYS